MQGNITTWKKKEGDQVSPGQVLAEVETDKATIDWEGQEDGYIAKLLVPNGAKDIAVGAPVAVLVDDKADVAAFKAVGYSNQSVLDVLVLAATKLISNYTNHLAETPLDPFMKGAEWTAPGHLKVGA